MTAAFVVHCNHSLLKKALPLGWSMLGFAAKGNTQAQRYQPLRNFYNVQRRCSISTEQPNTQFLASCKLKVKRTKPFFSPLRFEASTSTLTFFLSACRKSGGCKGNGEMV